MKNLCLDLNGKRAFLERRQFRIKEELDIRKVKIVFHVEPLFHGQYVDFPGH